MGEAPAKLFELRNKNIVKRNGVAYYAVGVRDQEPLNQGRVITSGGPLSKGPGEKWGRRHGKSRKVLLWLGRRRNNASGDRSTESCKLHLIFPDCHWNDA